MSLWLSRPHWDQRYYRGQCLTVGEAQRRLEKLGFYHPQSGQKGRLHELLHRAERGLPSYDQPTAGSLRTIAGASDKGYLKTAKKRELIHFLEEQDEKVGVEFERFMDLPPELRVQVYELYFKSLGPIYAASQPPITKVSRIVREESLPTFYEMSHFVIRVQDPLRSNRPVRPGPKDFFRFDPLTKRFFTSLNDTNLGRLLHVQLRTPNICPLSGACYQIRCDINLGRGTGEIQKDAPGTHYYELRDKTRTRGHIHKFERKIQGFLKVFATPGGRKLQRVDVDGLLAVGARWD
ncbi:hypothetical protein LTR37_002290 [Vermiconidia calcicola]|uniref:Uncharacterized protein n=1 Tax=Vermiconidia calcicola TaxID=1690605 RepID=A0ACC3NV15_9PEZI|nr:hypothetical protein LTR37_002290 [Vermiconidia calcicola]